MVVAPSPSLPHRAVRWAWVILLLGAWGVIAWDTSARAQRSLKLSLTYGVAVHPPAPDASSPSGYTLGRRSLLLPVLAPDAQHWVVQTQEMRARGDWRVRHVDYDNVPQGRDVHWGTPWRAWLLAVATLDHWATGVPRPLALERSALWAGPALLALALAVMVPWLARRFGLSAAAAATLALIGTPPFAEQFIAGNADHHGLAALCVVGLVTGAFAGLGAHAAESACNRTSSGRNRARRWFVASALWGALGMWISAATVIPVLLGMGLGALWQGWRSPAAVRQELAAHWRAWGLAGGIGSLLAYCAEYAPADFGWRLEVNHPLYSFAWYAGAEVIAGLLAWRLPDERSHWRRLVRLGLAAGVVLLPAALIVFVGPPVFLPADSFLSRVHTDYVVEGRSLLHYLRTHPLDAGTLARLAPLALLAVAVAGWCVAGRRERRRPDEPAPAGAADVPVVLGAAVIAAVMGVGQIRWLGLATPLAVLAAALVARMLAAPPVGASARWVYRLSVFALVLPAAYTAWSAAAQASVPIAGDVRRLAERDVAHRLRLRVGHAPLVIAATPNATTSMIYYAGARGLGTLFWENLPGQRRAAELFSASTFAEARRLVTEAGITHVVLFTWDPTDAMGIRLHRHLAPDADVPADAFAMMLRAGRIPAWLRPLPHPLPDHPLLRGEHVLAFEVTPDRSEDLIYVHAAAFALETRNAAAAAQFEPLLARYPDSPAALAMLAALQLARRDDASFRTTTGRLPQVLSRAAPQPLEDSVRIALALGIAGRTRDAAVQLQRALDRATEPELRRLTPGSLGDLAALMQEFSLNFTDANLDRILAEVRAPEVR